MVSTCRDERIVYASDDGKERDWSAMTSLFGFVAFKYAGLDRESNCSEDYGLMIARE